MDKPSFFPYCMHAPGENPSGNEKGTKKGNGLFNQKESRVSMRIHGSLSDYLFFSAKYVRVWSMLCSISRRRASTESNFFSGRRRR